MALTRVCRNYVHQSHIVLKAFCRMWTISRDSFERGGHFCGCKPLDIFMGGGNFCGFKFSQASDLLISCNPHIVQILALAKIPV